MAQGDPKFSFAKLNFFNRLDARARVFFLFGSIIGLIFLVYLGTRLLSGPSSTTGPSRVAEAPSGLRLVPGGAQSAEYNRMVEQASCNVLKKHWATGSSCSNTHGRATTTPCKWVNLCIICSDQTAVDVKRQFRCMG